MKVTVEITVERDGVELDVEVTGEVSPFVPARTWGPPENCSPAEGGEVEIRDVTLDGKPWSDDLTDDEAEAAGIALHEAASDSYDDEGPPERDYDMDDGGEPHGSYAGDES